MIYICKTGKICCISRCIVVLETPVDISEFKQCLQYGEAEWEIATDKDIAYLKEILP